MTTLRNIAVCLVVWCAVGAAPVRAVADDAARSKPIGFFGHMRAWLLEELDAVPKESIPPPADETSAAPESTPPKPEVAKDEPASPDAPKPADPRVAKTKDWKLRLPEISGYAQVHYRHAFDSNNDHVFDKPNFRVQRVRINIKGDITPWASYDIEVDPRAPEVAGVLRDAFLSLKFIPHHQLRIGQQKTQFGYENSESSTRLYTVNRADLSDNLARGVNLRDIGIGLIGKWPLGNGFRFEDAFTLVNGAGLNVQNDNNARKNFFGRIGLRYKNDDFVARLGVSGAVADILDPGNDLVDPKDDILTTFNRIGTDLEVDHRWAFLNFEYVQGSDDVAAQRFPDPVPPQHLDRKGYYITIGGKTPWKLGPLIRYDTVDNTFRRWTFGAYYGNPDDRLRFLVNYEIGRAHV